jgi:hypothetical protein
VAGFFFMAVLSWFPPIGAIIAGLIIGYIAAKAIPGAVISAILASVGAVVQILFISKVLPILGIAIVLIGFIPLSVPGLLARFGFVATPFFALGSTLIGSQLAANFALILTYALLGAVGGFAGGLVK